MRKINFSAGPSTLPLEILEQAQKNSVIIRVGVIL